jgi:nitrous oxide reductase accessory protein NosL
MRAPALVALIAVMAALVAGCGSSSPAPTPKEPERVTTKADVAAMEERLEEGEKKRPIFKREREECEAVTSEYEWLKVCVEPQTEKLARLVVKDEKLANELLLKVGEGCYKALRAATVFDHIEEKAIAGCKKDIGKREPASGGG